MKDTLIDLRSKKKAKEITIVLTSNKSFDEIEKIFYCVDYSFVFKSIVDNENKTNGTTEVIANAKRKAKSFDSLLNTLVNSGLFINIVVTDLLKYATNNNEEQN